MKLESAKCPNCGATLQLDPGASTAVCDFCHSTFSVKDALAYNGESKKEYRLKMADDCLEKGVIDEAVKIYSEISKEFPNDYRGWFGIIKCCPVTCDFQHEMNDEYDRALAFAPENEKETVKKHRQERVERINKFQRFYTLSNLINTVNHNAEKAKDELEDFKQMSSEKETEIKNLKHQISVEQEEIGNIKKRNKIFLIIGGVAIVLTVTLFFFMPSLAVIFGLAALVCLCGVASCVVDLAGKKELVKVLSDNELKTADKKYALLVKALPEKEAKYKENQKAVFDAESERESLAAELGIN